MMELIKKSLLTGLGIAIIAKDKLEKTAGRLVEEGKMSQEEAEKLIKELLNSGESQWQDIEAKIKLFVKETVSSLDLCSKKDFEQLLERIEKLEKNQADQ